MSDIRDGRVPMNFKFQINVYERPYFEKQHAVPLWLTLHFVDRTPQSLRCDCLFPAYVRVRNRLADFLLFLFLL